MPRSQHGFHLPAQTSEAELIALHAAHPQGDGDAQQQLINSLRIPLTAALQRSGSSLKAALHSTIGKLRSASRVMAQKPASSGTVSLGHGSYG